MKKSPNKRYSMASKSEYMREREKMYVSHWNMDDRLNYYEPLRDSYVKEYF